MIWYILEHSYQRFSANGRPDFVENNKTENTPLTNGISWSLQSSPVQKLGVVSIPNIVPIWEKRFWIFSRPVNVWWDQQGECMRRVNIMAVYLESCWALLPCLLAMLKTLFRNLKSQIEEVLVDVGPDLLVIYWSFYTSFWLLKKKNGTSDVWFNQFPSLMIAINSPPVFATDPVLIYTWLFWEVVSNLLTRIFFK